jgi:MFS family permease
MQTFSRITATVRQGISRDVAILCLLIFLADVIAGIMLSTYSLYASDLGISLALIGVLNTIGGMAQMFGSLPLGVMSDSIGRTRVLIGGMVAFLVAMLCLTVAGGFWFLLIGRVAFALAGIASFQIGAAHLGDITNPSQRSLAFGLYATAMGGGFAVGSLLGGQVADAFGLSRVYLVGGLIALVGLLIAGLVIHPAAQRHSRAAAGAVVDATAGVTGPLRRGWQYLLATFKNIGLLLRQPQLLLVTFGNMLVSLTFAGAVTTFFPLYGRELAITPAAIGSMFAMRALVSTMGRVPNGMISRIFGNQAVMLSALLLNAVAMFGIAFSSDSRLLTIWLAVEGLAFGGYLVAGQTFVADNTEPENRGTAIGVYATASSLGGALSPLILGLIATRWGVETVFVVTGWVLLFGFLGSYAGAAYLRRRSRAEAGSEPRS